MFKSKASFRYKGKLFDFESFIWEKPDIRLRKDSNERQCALQLAEGRDLGSGTEHVVTRARLDWKGILDEQGFARAQAIAEDITFPPAAFTGSMKCFGQPTSTARLSTRARRHNANKLHLRHASTVGLMRESAACAPAPFRAKLLESDAR